MTETPVPPAAGIDHPIARAVADAIAVLSSVAGPGEPGVWQLSGADCLAVKVGVNQLTAMLAAVDLQVVGELDASQATVEQAGVNTIAWLHGHCRQSLSGARAEVALARGLRGRFAGVAAGMSAGAVSREQAQAIVSVLTELPDDLAVDEVAKAEESMVDFAADHAPVGLRKLAGHLLAVVAPEVAGDLRQAIVLRDRGCVFPACHREPRDCDAHHIKPWEDGGPTSYDSGALGCPTHHRLVEPDPHADRATEHERWHMRMSADGIPEVIPPSINDDYRQPQRHKRFLLRR